MPATRTCAVRGLDVRESPASRIVLPGWTRSARAVVSAIQMPGPASVPEDGYVSEYPCAGHQAQLGEAAAVRSRRGSLVELEGGDRRAERSDPPGERPDSPVEPRRDRAARPGGRDAGATLDLDARGQGRELVQTVLERRAAGCRREERRPARGEPDEEGCGQHRDQDAAVTAKNERGAAPVSTHAALAAAPRTRPERRTRFRMTHAAGPGNRLPPRGGDEEGARGAVRLLRAHRGARSGRAVQERVTEGSRGTRLLPG